MNPIILMNFHYNGKVGGQGRPGDSTSSAFLLQPKLSVTPFKPPSGALATASLIRPPLPSQAWLVRERPA